MYCEVYIDVMFLTNFMMDSLVLLSVKGLMKKQGNTGWVFVAGAFGAGISCVLMTWLPMGWSQFLSPSFAGRTGNVVDWNPVGWAQ